MANAKDGQGQNIDFSREIYYTTIDNIVADYGQYAIQIEATDGVGIKISNVISNNCNMGISSYSYADIDNVTIHYADDFDLANVSSIMLYANKLSNLKLTGRWNLSTNLLDVFAIASTELNNITLDITHSGEAQYLPDGDYPVPFIKIESNNEDKAEIKVNNLKFPNFVQNFFDESCLYDATSFSFSSLFIYL